VFAHAAAPRVAMGVVGALVIQAATAVSAVTAIVALWRRRFGVARIAAAAQVSLILWGWLFAQYPYIVPPALSIRGAAAPPVTLRLLAIGLAAGAAVLLPSLRYLLRTFKCEGRRSFDSRPVRAERQKAQGEASVRGGR
jgi:cytochrome bd ubiquinol oxidase subunit II